MIPILLAAGLLSAAVSAIPNQHPLGGHLPTQTRLSGNNAIKNSRGLKGRFLHVTDVHPDGHYRPGTTDDIACHRGKGSSGYFGAEGTDCDAPMTLANETLRWIEENLKDDIDFVVWTGDSARHDYDEKIPRTEDEVFYLERFLTEGFIRAFRKNETELDDADPPGALSIPIVPTIGNNDVMPHNIMKASPNKWTKGYLETWNDLIPENQRHSFIEGGWFTTEVIPDKLAVVSLNTLYFFESNNAVDGCKSKSEPGYEHMEWLRIQLKLLRDRQMKAILIGHVPPARSGSKQNWDETCWQKYNLWLHRYRDVVIGSLYGHMNIDHFMFQDSQQIKIAGLDGDDPSDNSSDVSVQSRAGYLSSLREQWSKMPAPPSDAFLDELFPEDLTTGNNSSLSSRKSKKRKMKQFWEKIGGHWAERYSVSSVSPSVVPGYYPTLRIVEYNITGLEDTPAWGDVTTAMSRSDRPSYAAEAGGQSSLESDSSPEENIDKKKGKKGKKKKPKFIVPDPPSPSAPPGPAYSNQPLTWLGYTQYYANLTRINSEVAKLQELSETGSDHKSKEDTDKALHDIFSYEVEYNTREDKVYRLRDLTVRSYFKLASLIAETSPNKSDAIFSDDASTPTTSIEQNSSGNSSLAEVDSAKVDSAKKKKNKSKNQVWRTFLTRAFVGFLDIDQIDDLE